MKHIFLLSAFLLMSCQPASSDKANETQSGESVEKTTDFQIKPGVVRLRLTAPVSEPLACIIPIRIENGLAESTNVTMISFNLTGPGEDAKGNMFAPVATSGAFSEARVIVEGQSCDAYDTLSIPEIRCTSGEENCAAKVEFLDGGGLRFSQKG